MVTKIRNWSFHQFRNFHQAGGGGGNVTKKLDNNLHICIFSQ